MTIFSFSLSLHKYKVSHSLAIIIPKQREGYNLEHAPEFIKKLIIHIPEPGFNMLRYYDIYALPDSRIIEIQKRAASRCSVIIITYFASLTIAHTFLPHADSALNEQ
ncbi:MAG: transposase [Anaerovoracaceae bacterium]